MEYVKGAGYHARKCFCRDCNPIEHFRYADGLQLAYPIPPPEHLPSNHRHHHHRFVPPSKLGFYDSLTPYFKGQGFQSGINTYAEASQNQVKDLQAVLDEGSCIDDPPVGERRVQEIIARLHYLASKQGLGIHDFMSSLREDILKERKEKLDKKLEERTVVAIPQNPVPSRENCFELSAGLYPPGWEEMDQMGLLCESSSPYSLQSKDSNSELMEFPNCLSKKFPFPPPPERYRTASGRPKTRLQRRQAADGDFMDMKSNVHSFRATAPGNYHPRNCTGSEDEDDDGDTSDNEASSSSNTSLHL